MTYLVTPFVHLWSHSPLFQVTEVSKDMLPPDVAVKVKDDAEYQLDDPELEAALRELDQPASFW